VLGHGLGLKLALLKDLCDNDEHQNLAYNMDGILEVPAGKHKTC